MQVLCEDLGVKYDLASRDNFSFADSRVAFIHGMIPMPGQTLADTPGGTCASMPVLYVAVGRRLGYPLKLATTKGHVFVRWEGKDSPIPTWRARFNMEGTHGFSSFPDDYYKTWPFKLTDFEVQTNGYLVSLTPAEELAEFLASRGHCGMDNGQPAFAARCYENAYRYDPRRPAYAAWFAEAAGMSGYRPFTPQLVAMQAQRTAPRNPRQPLADFDFPRPSVTRQAAGATPGQPPGAWPLQPVTAGVQPHNPQIPQPGVLKPGSRDGAKPPQTGATNPYQPYAPPTPGPPNR
ncbi:MAG: hypothetical protein BIFFINMI_03947 [Phycisphaerae bacterium]|nr:hypothetical protein [Phycisphaerae bacterium]